MKFENFRPWNKTRPKWTSTIREIITDTSHKPYVYFDKMLGFHMQFCGFEIVLLINGEWYISDTTGG